MVTTADFQGTWCLRQVMSLTDLNNNRASIDTALDFDNIRGFCVRVPWNAIDGGDFAIFDRAKEIVDAHTAAGRPRQLSVRIMAGRHTPARVFNEGAYYYLLNGEVYSSTTGLKCPTPFSPSGAAGNPVFERNYNTIIGQMAAWCRANGVKLLHCSWWGRHYSEIDNDTTTVQKAPGYSQEAWLAGHKRLIDIAYPYAGNDLAIEFPFSGYWGGYNSAGDLTTHMLSKFGDWNPQIFVQANVIGKYPNANPAGSRPIYHGMQMFGVIDYDWDGEQTPELEDDIYPNLVKFKSVYLEIYVHSFTQPRAALLQSEINKFATTAPPPPPPPPPPTKSPIKGLLHGDGFPAVAARTHLSGYVLNVRWDELQNEENGPILDNNPIDAALTAIRADANNFRLKVRIGLAGGGGIPSWLRTAAGTVLLYDADDVWPAGRNIVRWWRLVYRNAYGDLMEKLSIKYDSAPEIRDFAITGSCLFNSTEPLRRHIGAKNADGSSKNVNALKAAGYTADKDRIAIKAAIDAHTFFTETSSSLSVSPWEWYNLTQRIGKRESTFAEGSFTLEAMRYVRTQLGARGVIGSADLDVPHDGTANQNLFPVIAAEGPPLFYRPQDPAEVHMRASVTYAVDNGASAVELPGTYPYASFNTGTTTKNTSDQLSDAELDTFDSKLLGTYTGGTKPPAVDVVKGTWALIQIGSLADLSNQRTAIDRALNFANMRGFSLRYPWRACHTNLDIVNAGHDVCTSHGCAYTIRFMAGQHTPDEVFNAGAYYYLSGTKKIPKPFSDAGVTGNPVFEQYYEEHVARLANWCRLNGVRILHLAWYGKLWAEIDNGPEIQAAAGYSQQAWLDGHKRLINIAAKYAGEDLAVEFALSGHWGGYNGAGSLLADHMVLKMGSWSGKVFVQANGLGVYNGKPTQKAVFHGMQMYNADDYNWLDIYNVLRENASTYVEVYVPSFGGTAAASLQNEITKFAGT